MNAYIRQAVEPDQQAIRTLVREAGINPLRLHWSRFIVAEGTDAVVGCGQLRPHRDGSFELASLAVTSSFQGNGIGATLVRTLISRAGSDLYLMCDSAMQEFYEPLGFRPIGSQSLPEEMRTLHRIGRVVAWAARVLFGQPIRILAMKRTLGG